jgi:IMP dehydrogenase
MKQALTYDDIQLIPKFSDITTRQDIDLTTNVSRNYKIRVPIVGSCMDTVCESEMAISIMEMGGVGCIHRFMSIEDQAAEVAKVKHFQQNSPESCWDLPIMAAVGAVDDYLERAQSLCAAGCQIILIDVAHGHHANVRTAIKTLKENLHTSVDVIAGNVATEEAARDLINWGADGLRVGIGGGSLCTTRVQTGFGVPNVTSILDCVAGNYRDIPIMADGGIKSSGDIAKALAVGADCVMVGSLISGTKESPGAILENTRGLYKRYRGSASLETKITHNQKQRNVEGESTIVPFKGGVKFILAGLIDGIKSAFSYTGASTTEEYWSKVEYNMVTNAGLAEAKPHLIS